jgi:hypothetical protein
VRNIKKWSVYVMLLLEFPSILTYDTSSLLPHRAICDEMIFWGKHIKDSMFIKVLSRQRQYNVPQLHTEINDNMFVSHLLLDNKWLKMFFKTRGLFSVISHRRTKPRDERWLRNVLVLSLFSNMMLQWRHITKSLIISD